MEKADIIQKEKGDTNDFLDGLNYTGDKGPIFGARYTQILLISIGTGIAFATYATFSLIIIAMTTADTSPNADIPVYDWNNIGVISGAILWSGMPIQIVAGYFGKLWGPKWLTLGASLVNAIFFMLIPVFADKWGSGGVIFCRVVQGAAQGGFLPLIAVISGIWVPADERSKASLITALGSLGTIMAASTLAGIISASNIGWTWCFYIFGIVELIWCILWFFLAYQSPQTHPRITQKELKYIEVSLSQQKKQKISTPWIKIITSIHFWAIIVAAIGCDWVSTTMATGTPLFLSKILEMDIKSTGNLTSIATLVGLLSGVVLAVISDLIVKRKIIRCVNARRLFHSVGTIGNTFNLLWLTFLKPGATGLIFLNLCMKNIFVLTYSVGGSGLTALDLSPVFAGLITGVASTFSQAIALFAPLSFDWIVHDNTNAAEWRTVFLVSVGITLVSTTFFDIFATDKRQWDWEVTSNVENSSGDERNQKDDNK